eukprot:GFKZ01011538.1.p3 GENE.GFKZ01011538.1~~GFKZ01011538.1.p3  ORF type:complete len:121 (+),score=2.36 GFKZ01011538.1:164-526(+)
MPSAASSPPFSAAEAASTPLPSPGFALYTKSPTSAYCSNARPIDSSQPSAKCRLLHRYANATLHAAPSTTSTHTHQAQPSAMHSLSEPLLSTGPAASFRAGIPHHREHASFHSSHETHHK